MTEDRSRVADFERETIQRAMGPFWGARPDARGTATLEQTLTVAVGLPVTVCPPGWYGGLLIRVHDGQEIRRYIPVPPEPQPKQRKSWWLWFIRGPQAQRQG